MIDQEDIGKTFIGALPAFVPDSEVVDFPYVVLGDFAGFVIDVYESGDETERMKAIQPIELLHIDGDPSVREAASIGLLEGVQNTWHNRGAISLGFEASVLHESRRWWDSLYSLLSGSIPHIGADLQK